MFRSVNESPCVWGKHKPQECIVKLLDERGKVCTYPCEHENCHLLCRGIGYFSVCVGKRTFIL